MSLFNRIWERKNLNNIQKSIKPSTGMNKSEQEKLVEHAMSIQTLAEWNKEKKKLRPLLSEPGFNDVAAHYNKLKILDQKWSEMNLNRLRYGRPVEYPLDYEAGKRNIDMYYDALLSFQSYYHGDNAIYAILNHFISHDGYSVLDNSAACDFAYGYVKYEYNGFADSGVLFHFEPEFSVEANVLLTNDEFYHDVECRVLAYCEENQKVAKKKIDGLLLKLRESLKSNFAEEPGKKPKPTQSECVRTWKSEDYYYMKNTDGTVTIVQYIGQEEIEQIPTVLDGLPVSGIDSNAFSYEDMTRLTIPECIRVIGEWMPLIPFYGSIISDELILPAGIVIKGRSFMDSSLPKTVVIPVGAVLERDCFSCCETVETLFVGPYATLKGGAFSSCKDLRRIVCAPDSTIEDEAFDSCERLEKVILCGDVKLGEDVFSYSDEVEITAVAEGGYARLMENALIHGANKDMDTDEVVLRIQSDSPGLHYSDFGEFEGGYSFICAGKTEYSSMEVFLKKAIDFMVSREGGDWLDYHEMERIPVDNADKSLVFHGLKRKVADSDIEAETVTVIIEPINGIVDIGLQEWNDKTCIIETETDFVFCHYSSTG